MRVRIGLVLPDEGGLEPGHLVGLAVHQDDVRGLQLADEAARLAVVGVGAERDVVDLEKSFIYVVPNFDLSWI